MERMRPNCYAMPQLQRRQRCSLDRLILPSALVIIIIIIITIIIIII